MMPHGANGRSTVTTRRRPFGTPGVVNGRRPELAAPETLGGLKILAVDDQKTMHSILRQLVHEIGINQFVEAEESQ